MAVLRVKAEGVNFGRLAGGILASALRERSATVDAAGAAALSNATKAVALANALAEKQATLTRLAFEPQMVVAAEAPGSPEDRKICRLLVRARTPSPGEEASDFSRGGIVVSNALHRTNPVEQQNPTKLARTVMGEWMRFAAPELRQAARDAARQGGEASVTRPIGRRATAPFLVAMGGPSISLAVKSLAFVCNDLQKNEHLAGVPPLLVVPKLHERKVVFKEGQEKISKMLILRLVRADDGSDAYADERK